MYFLVKNIRSCSKLRKYSSLEKHEQTKVNDFLRYMSHFAVHPEKLRQAVKERDAHMLCQFFDSDEYKKRVTEFLEMQSKILTRNSLAGAKAANVEYQHVLSCAQPSYQAAKTVINEKSSQDHNKDDRPRKRRVKKGTIIEQMLMTKSRNEVYQPETNRTTVVKTAPAKKITHRTTIMPIFLKKLRNRQRPRLEHIVKDSYNINDAENEDLPDPAKEMYYEEEPEPMYAQILQRSDLYRNRYKTKIGSNQTLRSTNENANVDASLKSYSGTTRKQFHRVHKSPSVVTAGPSSTRLASSISHKPPSVKLCPKKKMNLKSYSELLLVEPVKCRSSKTQSTFSDNEDGKPRINVVKAEQTSHSNNSLLQLVQETQKKKQLILDMDIMDSEINVKQESKNKCRERELQLMPLYKKLKIGIENLFLISMCHITRLSVGLLHFVLLLTTSFLYYIISIMKSSTKRKKSAVLRSF
ncbi:uncharacterized protein LOC143192857 isoform X1 [Rhynchophorus ferrugineus]|uniref:uncharacterized protein LOC143192857 isoform X1 n=1 Tax=Rhynchophorus ferrugineus TaxID=354439 RepID=UPI003FCCAB94